MSHTTLYAAFEDGDMQPVHDYANSFCGAYVLWKYMAGRYLDNEMVIVTRLADRSRSQKLWDLAGDFGVPFCKRVTHATTFDGVLVRGSERARVAACMKEVSALLPPENHIGQQAEDILALPETVRAIGWRQTSVARSFWTVPVGEEDERPYNIDKDTAHWFLFDEIR